MIDNPHVRSDSGENLRGATRSAAEVRAAGLRECVDIRRQVQSTVSV